VARLEIRCYTRSLRKFSQFLGPHQTACRITCRNVPGTALTRPLGAVSCDPNGTDLVAPHQKTFSQVVFGSDVSDTACIRSNALSVVCEKTRRSFVNGRDLSQIEVCKRSKLALLRYRFRPIHRVERRGFEPRPSSMRTIHSRQWQHDEHAVHKAGSDGHEQLL
jgi:hypothetical protein